MTRLFAFLLMLVPGAALTHPHVFVETGLRVLVSEDGALQGVEVTWAYDELYSLLVLEEMALDPDYDGVLTEAELAALDGFDLQWIPGYLGDLYVTRDGVDVALGAPEGLGTEVVDGKIVTRHRRSLTGPAAGVEVRAFDPTYYTSYDLGRGVEVTGSCAARVEAANLVAAEYELLAIMRDLEADRMEMDYPAVGALFADRVVIACETG